MKLSTRSKSYMIPEYNLTGDLLSFLTCNLQYRYQNKGTLPPFASPAQARTSAPSVYPRFVAFQTAFQGW